MRFFFILLFTNNLFSQTLIHRKINLESQLFETSGIEKYNDNKFISFNDSGNEPILFILNQDYKIEGKTNLPVQNFDWEDITYDGENYFLSDLGNNNGNRKNLVIHKINSNLELENTLNISYKNQGEFKKDTLNEFDSETIISWKNRLLIFSKNRKFLTTEVFEVDKNLSNQKLARINAFDAKALITSGDYNKETNTLILLGYNFKREHFLFVFKNFSLKSKLTPRIILLDELKGKQAEAIKFISRNKLIITSEAEKNKQPKLWEISISDH